MLKILITSGGIQAVAVAVTLAYAPDRNAPGNARFGVANTPMLAAGGGMARRSWRSAGVASGEEAAG